MLNRIKTREPLWQYLLGNYFMAFAGITPHRPISESFNVPNITACLKNVRRCCFFFHPILNANLSYFLHVGCAISETHFNFPVLAEKNSASVKKILKGFNLHLLLRANPPYFRSLRQWKSGKKRAASKNTESQTKDCCNPIISFIHTDCLRAPPHFRLPGATGKAQ